MPWSETGNTNEYACLQGESVGLQVEALYSLDTSCSGCWDSLSSQSFLRVSGGEMANGEGATLLGSC